MGKLSITSLGILLALQVACTPPPNLMGKSAYAVPVEGATPVTFSEQKPETCFTPSEACDTRVIEFLNKSQKTLDIAIYSITHPQIVAAIVEAHKRGVQVRMVVDRTQAAGHASMVDDLKAAGVPLKIGATGRAIMHHKFSIVDEAGLQTGSFNYTRNASFENSENQLYIFEKDVIEKYQKDFEVLWSNGIQ